MPLKIAIALLLLLPFAVADDLDGEKLEQEIQQLRA
jgi:hypothetical protein